eukprot:SAG22_NODE_11633_length_476_cov_0.814324_1_plen_32_part_10
MVFTTAQEAEELVETAPPRSVARRREALVPLL